LGLSETAGPSTALRFGRDDKGWGWPLALTFVIGMERYANSDLFRSL
jgi:hypothetical protein